MDVGLFAKIGSYSLKPLNDLYKMILVFPRVFIATNKYFFIIPDPRITHF